MIGKVNMRSKCVFKKVNYRYVLTEPFFIQTHLHPRQLAKNDYVELHPSGLMKFSPTYAWNGPNFPAVHTEKSILASLPHDGGYQLIEEGLLPEGFRFQLDALLGSIVAEPAPANILLSCWRKVRGWSYFVVTDLFGGRYIKARSQTFTIN